MNSFRVFLRCSKVLLSTKDPVGYLFCKSFFRTLLLKSIVLLLIYSNLVAINSRTFKESVGLLLVILTSSINILVIYLLVLLAIYLLVLLAIYLQIDIYPRFIYKLILFLNWI